MHSLAGDAAPALSLGSPVEARELIPSGARGIRTYEIRPRPATNRAAQYVRMSTEHQQFSIANQADAISGYAREHRFDLVRSYFDDGRSGLSLQGRPGLQALLADVTSGQADFQIILIYDVSRWGRFQDSDESAFYEYLCRRAGVHVEYCMEPFDNDGAPMSSVVKVLKRIMAAEYSRELSDKVFAGQKRLALMGYRVGGRAGYGLRRMVIGADGQPRGVLDLRQSKFVQDDRVVLVPGPVEEQEVVRWIFDEVAHRQGRPTAIVAELNGRGVLSEGGVPWTDARVLGVLGNEKYIGNLVRNRHSCKLKTRRVRNPPEKWIRADGACEPVVSPKLFWAAQEAMSRWTTRITSESAIAALRALYVQHGRLSAELINSTEGMPGSVFYEHRFGGLVRAYALAGYIPERNYGFQDGHLERRRQIAAVRAAIVEKLRARGVPVVQESKVIIVLRGAHRIGVMLAFTKIVDGAPKWEAQIHKKPFPDLMLIARQVPHGVAIKDYCLTEGGRNLYLLGVEHRRPRVRHFETSLDGMVGHLAAM
jgi:DNA invertase Pin-like site-specific DNA recombinase